MSKSTSAGLSAPAQSAEDITPSDSDDLPNWQNCRSIFVGTGGNLSVIAHGDTDPRVYINIPDGTVLPIRARRVRATGTTASNLIAWY